MTVFATAPNFWRGLTEPSSAIVDPDQRVRARLLSSILLPLMAITVLGVITGPLLSGESVSRVTPATFVGLFSFAFLVIAYVLARSRWYEYGAVVTVFIAVVGAWQAFLANRELPGGEAILAFLVVAQILSAILLPPSFTVAVTLLQVSGLVAAPVFIAPSIRKYASVFIIAVLMVGALAAVSDSVRRRDQRLRLAAETALRSSEEQFRLAFDAAAVGRGVITLDGRWLRVNDALTGLLGFSRQEMLSAYFPDITLADDRAASIQLQRRMVAGDIASYDIEKRYVHKLGHTIWVRTAVALVRDGYGKPLYLIGDFQDITARRQVEEARLLALERLSEISRLKEVNTFKTQLLNTASHELNTPIAALRTQLYVLRSSQLAEAKKEHALQILDRNVQRLALLVRDVLDVARLDAGQLALRKAPVDVDAVLGEALDAYEEPAREAGVRLHRRLDSHATVEADADRLMQVAHNFLSNALKFTPPGGEILVESQPSDDGVVVNVRDSGAGLTAAQIARLFQPFSQVHDTMQQTRAGTGLGLYISKGVVEQHGGRIWALSDGPGRGTEFSFTLPPTVPTRPAGVLLPHSGGPAPPDEPALASRARPNKAQP